MKLLRWAALPALTTVLLLPTMSAAALPVEPDYPCYMRTASGRSQDLTGLCNGSKNAGAFAEASNAAPLVLYVKSIRNSALTGYISIKGSIVNQSNEDQDVSSFDYRLLDRATGKSVAVSLSPVNKTIPPHGRVSFETVIEKSDVGGVPPSRLYLELVKFR